jgi:RNA-splicing ligase RtcB
LDIRRPLPRCLKGHRRLHAVEGKSRELFVHRTGATRAFGPGHAQVEFGTIL